jgi:hypothetical protein
MGVPEECQIPSLECDKKVQSYCNQNPNDLDFCGCSTNALAKISDPRLGNSPVKCWAKSCTQNANAYQFFFTQTDNCPDVCIDNSTITALGSNITASSFNQASCGATQKTDNSAVTKTLTDLYLRGFELTILFFVITCLLLLSIFSLSSMVI